MSVLTIPAAARAVELHVRREGRVPLADLAEWVARRHGLSQRTADAGVRLAAIGGRIQLVEDTTGSYHAVPPERVGAR